MKHPINILFLTDGLAPGGKERQLIEILKHIDRERFKTGVITFNKNHFYSHKAKTLTDHFYELDKSRNKFKPLFSIWKCFKQFQPDIVHTWDSLSSFYAYLPIRHYKIKFIDGSIRDSGIEKGWEFYYKKFFLKRADLIISNSKAGLEYYKVKGKVFYNAINMERFLPLQNIGEFNIIKVANFTKYKDHKTFMKASLQLVKSRIVDNVYLVGNGPNKIKYEKLVNKLPDIISQKFHFLGTISNVEEYLSKCRVGVLCSTSTYSEGISNAVLEYMAAGLVPICTGTGGIFEIIQDGVNGFLIGEKEVDKIIELIKLIKINIPLRDKIIKGAYKTINNKFNYYQHVKKIVEIYEQILWTD